MINYNIAPAYHSITNPDCENNNTIGGPCTCPIPKYGSNTFYELLDKAAEIHSRKSSDYASKSDPLGNYRFAGLIGSMFSDPTDIGLMTRFAEKLYRLKNLEGREPLNESIEDTENDLLVIIGLFISNRRDRRLSRNRQIQSE
jgi:hypothetical protein